MNGTLSLFACFVGLAAADARAQQSAPAALPGYRYTLTVTSDPPGGRPGVTGGPGSQSYVGHAVVAGNRGRMDIVEGGVEPLFMKGDYLLFDSTDVAIVHPARAELILLTRETITASSDRLAAAGITMTLHDQRVALDSLGPGDTISGIPTTRYRMALAFNMDVDAPAMRSRLGSEAITDYWVATVPGLPPNPLLRSNGLANANIASPMMRDLSARVDSAAARMGKSVVLRSSSTTRIIAGPGQRIETHSSSLVSNLERHPVERAALAVPGSYRVAPFPGLEQEPVSDGAKWKTPPTD